MRLWLCALSLAAASRSELELEREAKEEHLTVCCLLGPVVNEKHMHIQVLDSATAGEKMKSCLVLTFADCQNGDCVASCETSIQASKLTWRLIRSARLQQRETATEKLTRANEAFEEHSRTMDEMTKILESRLADKEKAEDLQEAADVNLLAAQTKMEAAREVRTPASCEGKSNCCCSYVSGNVALPVMVQAATFSDWHKCTLVRPYAPSGWLAPWQRCWNYMKDCSVCRTVVCAHGGKGSCNWSGH
mmetsp:Transcript_133790/g.317048  ORF Transcript_133790/g.317048 Transcript_133790/m.317048 type:complete len:247 (+) Transcript_133790:61-801(+)